MVNASIFNTTKIISAQQGTVNFGRYNVPLEQLAGNIAANLGEGTAEELVEFALRDEGRDSWGIEIPAWFDEHDRSLLTDWVAESL